MNKLRTANLLGALTGAISVRLQKSVKTHPNQNESFAAALRTIAIFEGCSNGQLSHGLNLSHSATVRLVSRLVDASLVESRKGADKRSVALYLTPLGEKNATEILQQRCLVLSDLVDQLNPKQQAQLDDISATLLEKLAEQPFLGGHICRLCDHNNCPEDSCPVHVNDK
jgi:DNA-binding MarR family transcriptional regulator